MDEKFIQKYFDEFRKFSLMLEEKEKKVFAMSNVDYDVDRGIYDAIEDTYSNMSYSDYVEEESKKNGTVMSENEFEAYKKERVAALNRNSVGRTDYNDVYQPHMYTEVESEIDDITKQIREEIAREKKVISNLIRTIEAQLSVYQDELDDCYKAMINADTNEEKVRLGVEFNVIKKNHEINKQALADMKMYRRLIDQINKAYSRDDSSLTYDSMVVFADKIHEVEASVKYLGDKLDNVDYNEFQIDVTFDPIKNVNVVNCRCGNVVLFPAPEFVAGQITPDTIDGILYKFADKVAANSPLSVEEIKAKDIKCVVYDNNYGKVPFANVGEVLCSHIDKDLNNANGLDNPSTPEQDDSLAPESQTPPVPGQDNSPAQGQQTPPVPGQDNSPAQGQQTPPVPGQDNSPAQGQQTPPVPGQDNPPTSRRTDSPMKELMKEAKRIKSVRNSRLHKAEMAGLIATVAAAGLGATIFPPAALATIPALVATGGVAATDVISKVKDKAKVWAVTHKYNSIAKKLTKKLGGRKSGIKCYVKSIPNTGEIRFMISQDGKEIGPIDSHSTGYVLCDELGYWKDEANTIVNYLNKSLNKAFDYMNNDEKRKGTHYEKYRIPKVDVDNLEAAYVEYGGYDFGLEGDQYAEMDIRKKSRKKRKKGREGIFNKRGKIGDGTSEDYLGNETEWDYLGDDITEANLEDIAERNEQAVGDGTSEGEALSEDEKEEFLDQLYADNNGYEQGQDDYSYEQSQDDYGNEQGQYVSGNQGPWGNFQDGQNPINYGDSELQNPNQAEQASVNPGQDEQPSVDPAVASRWSVDDEQDFIPLDENSNQEMSFQEVEQNRNLNDALAANINSVLESLPITATLHETERQQFVNEILMQSEARQNEILNEIYSGNVVSIDELRNVILQDSMAQEQSAPSM